MIRFQSLFTIDQNPKKVLNSWLLQSGTLYHPTSGNLQICLFLNENWKIIYYHFTDRYTQGLNKWDERWGFFSYSVTTYYFSPLFVFSARNFVILIFICAFFSIESAHIVNRLILFGIIIWFSVSLGFFFLFCEVMFMFFPSVVC